MTERSHEELLEDLEAIRREWLRWSVDRLEKEAAQVLDLEEPGPVEDLSDDQILQLLAEWEPIHSA